MRRSLMLGAALLVTGSLAMAQPPGGERPQGERPPGGEGRGFGDGRGFGGPPSNPVFDVLDADKDGNISAKELEGAVAALKTLDKDGDGVISREEARPTGGFGRGGFGGGPGGQGGGGPGGPGGGGPGGGGQFTPEGFIAGLMERDTNKDGKLSAEELGERGARMLENGDTNGDGHMDAEELKAMASRFGGGGGGRGRDGGGRPGEGGRPPAEGGGDRPARPAPEGSNDRI